MPSPVAPVVELTEDERAQLVAWARRSKSANAVAMRSRIVLAAADGLGNTAVAAKLGVQVGTARKWRNRFLAERLEGVLDEPRPGRPRTVVDEQVEAVITRTLETSPRNATHWSTRSLAAELGLTAQIDQLTARIEQLIVPLERQVAQLDEISGIGRICAQDIIAEIGVNMAVFATAAHLVSWAKFCPQVHQSGGRQPRNRATGRGDPWLASALGEAAAGAARTRTFLGERYRRLARRRGKKKALVAVGNSMLTIIWHLLADPDAHYRDLGPDFYETHINQRRRERSLIGQLEQITGMKVTLQPAPQRPAA